SELCPDTFLLARDVDEVRHLDGDERPAGRPRVERDARMPASKGQLRLAVHPEGRVRLAHVAAAAGVAVPALAEDRLRAVRLSEHGIRAGGALEQEHRARAALHVPAVLVECL